MSASALLNPNTGTLMPQFLPVGPAPTHPYLENPFQDPVDGNNEPLTNLASLNINAQGAIPVGLGLNVGGGANALITGKLGVANNKYLTESNNNLAINNGDTGAVEIECDQGLVVVPNNTTGTGKISVFNGTSSAVPTYYDLYVGGTTGGGISANHLQVFGYSAGLIREVFDAEPDGSSIALGDDSIVGGCVLSVNGPSGSGRVYDELYNRPVVAQQIPGTLALISIPATGGANPAKTLATLTITGAPRNSFTVYLKFNTGVLSTTDGTAYVFQYFLSDTIDGNLDETKGCLVGYTPGVLNQASAFIPSTTLLYRSATPTNTIYLNIQSIPTTPHSGCQLANATWTADVYASSI